MQMRAAVLVAGLTGWLLTLPASTIAAHIEVHRVSWSLSEVSPSGRLVRVIADRGACDGPTLHVTAREAATTVTLTAVEYRTVPDYPGEVMCPQMNLTPITGGVVLHRSLAGRHLITQSHVQRLTARFVPRMVGVRATDAVVGLRAQGILVHRRGPRDGVVVRQAPAPGQYASHGVTLVAR
jgi:hypothetical protein